MTESANPYLKKLEDVLTHDFAAAGGTLTEKLDDIRAQLPEELCSRIDNLTKEGSSSAIGDEWVFSCGQVMEQLRGVLHAQAAENVAASHPNGITPEELAATDLDAVARFIAARDRFMRVVANFTLKALLIIIVLLIIGLAFGIV